MPRCMEKGRGRPSPGDHLNPALRLVLPGKRPGAARGFPSTRSERIVYPNELDLSAGAGGRVHRLPRHQAAPDVQGCHGESSSEDRRHGDALPRHGLRVCQGQWRDRALQGRRRVPVPAAAKRRVREHEEAAHLLPVLRRARGAAKHGRQGARLLHQLRPGLLREPAARGEQHRGQRLPRGAPRQEGQGALPGHVVPSYRVC